MELFFLVMFWGSDGYKSPRAIETLPGLYTAERCLEESEKIRRQLEEQGVDYVYFVCVKKDNSL
jgi:hypothetical protein